MTAKKLQTILAAHHRWSGDSTMGQRADLAGANLVRANLAGANLAWANLTGADLTGATGLFDACDWIAANLKRVRGGVEAYKTFGSQYVAPDEWIIEPGAVISENVNPLPTLACACGVNVGTLDWVTRNNQIGFPIWRLLVKWEWLAGGVIPYDTTGKFRVPKAQLLGLLEKRAL